MKKRQRYNIFFFAQVMKSISEKIILIILSPAEDDDENIDDEY